MGCHLKNLVQIIHITPRSLYEIPNNRLTSIDIMFANIYWIEIQVKAFLFWWLMTFWGFDSSAVSCSTLQHNLNIGRGIHRHSFLGAFIQRFAEKIYNPYSFVSGERDVKYCGNVTTSRNRQKKINIWECQRQYLVPIWVETFPGNSRISSDIFCILKCIFSGQQNAQTAKSNYRP